MTETVFSIGDLARQTGCKVQTIRWYEAVGLLPRPARTAGGHRTYGHAHRERLDFIRHAREFGFPLAAIRSLLLLATRPDQASCVAAHEIASAQLADVENKLRRMEVLRAELAHMVQTGCRGTPADCRILATLADHDHGLCLTTRHADPAAHEPDA
jgi:DNA-binding transcriptional MerR regulator